jgi:hypothetical protein
MLEFGGTVTGSTLSEPGARGATTSLSRNFKRANTALEREEVSLTLTTAEVDMPAENVFL